MAVVAANAALDQPAYTEAYVAEVMGESKSLVESWLVSHRVEFWLSEANYIWCFPDNAEKLGEYLQQQGFLVRPKAYQERLGLRITVGVTEQMRALLAVWERFLS